MVANNDGDVSLDALAVGPSAPSDPQQASGVCSNAPSSTARSRYRRLLPSEMVELLHDQQSETRWSLNATRSTRYMLHYFHGLPQPVVSSPEEQMRRRDWEARQKRALEILERLKKPTGWWRISRFWRTSSEMLRLHHAPADYDAREACRFWFPQPASIPILVCDIWEDGGRKVTSKLANIEDCKASC